MHSINWPISDWCEVLKGKKASCRYSFIVSLAPQHWLRAGAIIVNCIKESLDQRDHGVGITFWMISISRVFPVANFGLLKVDINVALQCECNPTISILYKQNIYYLMYCM